MTMDRAMIEQVYASMRTKQEAARRLMGRPLTLTEKILFAHVAEMPSAPPVRRKGYVDFHPDRVAMQDATAQMAILQFMLAGRDDTAGGPGDVEIEQIQEREDGKGDRAQHCHRNDPLSLSLIHISEPTRPY